MSGISGKKGTIAFAVQSAKGVAAAAPTHRFCLAGDPTLGPVKNRGRYSMTDSSQDRGPAYTSLLAVEGDVPVYLHPQGVGLLFGALLGDNTDSGAGPDYTHTIVPAEDMLWLTAWREVGGVIFEKFVDVKLVNAEIEGDAGSPYVGTFSAIGCDAEYLDATADAAERTALLALDPFDDAGYLYPESESRIKIATVAEKIHRLSIGMNRNASGYQSDGYGYDDVDPGEREFTLSFATRFQSGAIGEDEYREFFYGSAAGTTLSPVTGTKAFEVEILRDATTSLKIAFPQVTYAAVPVNPSPGGEPIEVEVACEVEKPTDGSDIVTVTVKDQKTSINV